MTRASEGAFMAGVAVPGDVAPALSCWVAGKPRPKGSLDGLASGRARENNDASLPWRRHVAAVAQGHWWNGRQLPPIAAPVAVTLRFLFDRPSRATWPVPATTQTGDIDKLTRNVLDALSACDAKCLAGRACAKHAGVFVDDALVCGLDVKTRYALPRGQAGVLIEVRVIDLEAL